MIQPELENICQKSCDVVRTVGSFLKQELGKVSAEAIEIKSLNSLVSYVDKTAEEQLVKGLGEIVPEATFLTEEKTVEQKEGVFQWIIDPLDGTTNFLHQLPFFSISVALQHHGKTVLGIVLEVNRDECFYAWKGAGAFLNNKKIKVSSTKTLGDSLIATGFPYYDYDHAQSFLKTLDFFMRNTRGIRRFGSAALDLVYVACGRFDAFYEYSLNAWDVAGGAFIVQEAGGVVSDFKGESNYLFGKEIIAVNPNIHDAFFKAINSSFYPT
jgi:myo-inositol-1(or 4)-monophosphatase